MRVDSLYEDFITDLESFVKNPIQIETELTEPTEPTEQTEQTEPTEPVAPERYIVCGKKAGISWEQLVYALQAFPSTERIESMLRVYATDKLLRSIEHIDPVKEQVWLMGYKWLSYYYEALTEPGVMRSEFYKQHNDRFLILLKSMVAIHPSNRVSFVNALRAWCPRSSLLQTDESVAEPVPSVSADTSSPTIRLEESVLAPRQSVASAESAVHAQSSNASTTSTTSTTSPASKPRLVLTRPVDPEERNKTRKNRHN